jgi:HEAT repeat protein
MARQLIGAELLSALAGRNVERRERARAAFVEHGYFDEKTRDVREAAAPAERAAAARSLAIVGDRTAAPHLIAALEDDSMEVRRAAVEALGALREPSAVEPLEALLRRERNERNRIPSRIIQHAAETCRLAAVEEARAADEAARAEEAASKVEVRTPQAEAVEPQVEVAAPQVKDVTPPEEVVPREEEVALVEEVGVSERAVEAQPVEKAQSVVELQPVEEAQTVEEPLSLEEPSHAGEAPALGDAAFELEFEDAGAGAPVAESNAVEPFVSSGEREGSAKAGEWVELDMSDIRAQETAPAAEPVFEFSSGATIQAEQAAEHEAQTAAAESLLFETAEETPTVETPVETRGAEEAAEVSAGEFERGDVSESPVEPSFGGAAEAVTARLPSIEEKGVVPINEHSIVPAVIQHRLTSRDAAVRAAAITELSHVDTDEAFQQICSAFDDEAKEVRSAAARALYELRADRAESFTRALREASPDRRRNVGAAISSSGLAGEAVSQLTGESRDKTYEAFSLLFLMAKAGEVQPLVRAIEGHPNNEVRLAVVKLLALSGQKEILPAFRRLAVRGSLPTEVRSAVMEAIYQISSSQPTTV